MIALVLVSALWASSCWRSRSSSLCLKKPANIDALKALLEIIFAPIVGLVGAVTGFYFGEKSRYYTSPEFRTRFEPVTRPAACLSWSSETAWPWWH